MKFRVGNRAVLNFKDDGFWQAFIESGDSLARNGIGVSGGDFSNCQSGTSIWKMIGKGARNINLYLGTARRYPKGSGNILALCLIDAVNGIIALG